MVGVPEITPVDESRLSPPGNERLTVQVIPVPCSTVGVIGRSFEEPTLRV